MEQSKKQTEIVVVLDRSGSMSGIQQSTVDGFNSFLKEQQGAEGEAFLSLIQFDDKIEKNYISIPIIEAKPLIAGKTYIPRGFTSLLDAIGTTIEEINTDRDVVFVIITDGAENSSSIYTQDAIFKMIETLKAENSWKFLFLGANQDAIKVGAGFGITSNNSVTYTASNDGIISVMSSVNKNMRMYRSSKLSSDSLEDAESSLSFSDEQRDSSLGK